MKLFDYDYRLLEEAGDVEGSSGDTGDNTPAGDEGNDDGNVGEGDSGDGEGDVSEEELAQAKSLFKLLKDPSTSNTVIEQLARRSGILKDIETRSDVRDAKKDLKAIVKDKLGSEYAFLADKLGDVMEAVLEEERITNKAELGRVEAAQTEREVQNVLDKLSRETKGESRKVESKMIDLMDKFTIGKGITVEDYLRGLYAQATAGRTSNTVKGQMADKIKRNANDAASRLHSTSTGNKGAGEGVGDKKRSLNESVNFALEQMAKQK